ncbi:MAG TPA: hypothetical protein VH640_20465, partial [Bryobacteraceae bacterium]
MKPFNTVKLFASLAFQLLGASVVSGQALIPAVLRNYQPVTDERLRKPEGENWLMNRRTYDGWGYSPLDQITPANVARLRPV